LRHAIYTFLLLLSIHDLRAQSDTGMNRIGYIADLPFFVESASTLKDTVTFFPEGAVDIRLTVLSPHVRVGVTRQSLTYTDLRSLNIKYNRKKQEPGQIRYHVENAGSSKPVWTYNLPGKNGDSVHYLLDTVLATGSSLRLHFTDQKGIGFQVLEIVREPVVPAIDLFRIVKNKDTTLTALRKHLTAERDKADQFSPYTYPELFKIKAGDCLELLFKDKGSNEDSIIFYRLIEPGSNGNWQRTGHFTLLKGFRGNTRYQLEVKYKGADVSGIINLQVLPAWYNTPAAMVGFIASGLLLLLTAGYIRLRIRWNKEKRKQELHQYKFKALQAQLNPHFIFNALNSIQSLVNNDRKNEANQYLNSFSFLLRGALKNSETAFIHLGEEIELLKKYLQLEQLRFRFQTMLRVDETLALFETDIPPMLIQPVVENAVKYAVSRQEEGAFIHIIIMKAGDGFTVEVCDSGQWIDPVPGKGYGLSLTKERIASLNNLDDGREIVLTIVTDAPGTKVLFEFKNWFL